jgi:hypothetical protein
MNTLERIRTKVGLTRPQMMRLLEDNPDSVILKPTQALSLFSMTDEEIVEKVERRVLGTPSSLIRRAQEIEEKYDQWIEEITSRLESLAAASDGRLRTRDVARILGISDFHLSQLRIRGVVEATQESSRRFVYTLEEVLALVESNSTTVTPESRKTRGPLTNAFISWAAEWYSEQESDSESTRELVSA